MNDDRLTLPVLDSLTKAEVEAALLLLHGRYVEAARMLLFGTPKDTGSGAYQCPTCRQRFGVSDKRNAHVRDAHSPRAAAPREM